MVQALNEMKTGKAPEISDVLLHLITASREVEVRGMAEFSQRILE